MSKEVDRYSTVRRSMQMKLLNRILEAAQEMRKDPKWKRRLYAIAYSSSLKRVLTGRL